MASPRHRGMADFFAPDVFQAVLSDPATAARLKAFCNSNACGENIAFLEKIDQYNQLLLQARDLLAEINATFTSPNATDPINITGSISKNLTSAIDTAAEVTLPIAQNIFVDARTHVEDLVREDIYPRFVAYQLAQSATKTLSHDRSALGDCFCLTDPSVADNAIIYASDGFIDVTGYSRRDIVPRNCRFLQGPKTDRSSVTRIRSCIDSGDDCVELLLNYRKNGSPFWNLLYVAPLRDETGKIVFFLGGQIDCSAIIHSNPDVLRILEFDGSKSIPPRNGEVVTDNSPSPNGSKSHDQVRRPRGLFRHKSSHSSLVEIQQGAGMEDDMVKKIGHMGLKTQMEAFQTAYSKYLVIKIDNRANFKIAHCSTSAAKLLRSSRQRGTVEPILNEDVFKVLADRSPSSSSVFKSYKKAVTDHLTHGKAVSVNLKMVAQQEEDHSETAWPPVKIEKYVVSHWTPCKDGEGRAKYVVLVFAEVLRDGRASEDSVISD